MQRRRSTIFIELDKVLGKRQTPEGLEPTTTEEEAEQDGPIRQGDTPPHARRSQPPRSRALRYQLWLLVRKLKSYEFKFALKMAVAVSILCVPAFFPSSAAWFIQERCQWASITVRILICKKRDGFIFSYTNDR